MLAVKRQVVVELVDQHPGQEAHVHAGTLQHVRRGGRRRQPARAPALDDQPTLTTSQR